MLDYRLSKLSMIESLASGDTMFDADTEIVSDEFDKNRIIKLCFLSIKL